MYIKFYMHVHKFVALFKIAQLSNKQSFWSMNILFLSI